METIYTIGYKGLSIDALEAVLTDLDAFLVDVRLKPTGKDPAFRKHNLQKRFGDARLGPAGRYVFSGDYFGNLNYRGGSIRLKNPSQQALHRLKRYLVRQPIVLMCVCPEHEKCHRSRVAELLARYADAPVQHLYPGTESAQAELAL